MKTVFKVIVVMALIASSILMVEAKSFVQTKSKRITAEKISSDAKGNLTYKASGFSQKVKPGKYLYARIPMPKSVTKAYKLLKSKKYDKALKAFNSAYAKYRYLGWNVYCIYYSGIALDKLKKTDAAIAKLNELKSAPLDREKMGRYLEAKKLLATLYIEKGDFSKAQNVLKELGNAKNSAIAAFSNVKQGDILLKQGKKKDALLMYLRTVLLFTKSNTKERPEAFKKTITILKNDKNNKYLIFEKMAKADYPNFK